MEWKILKFKLITPEAPFTLYNLLLDRLSKRFNNRLYRIYKHSTGCQTGCTTRFDNPLNEQWLFVQHGCQTGCQTGLTDNRLSNRLYRVNGVLTDTIEHRTPLHRLRNDLKVGGGHIYKFVSETASGALVGWERYSVAPMSVCFANKRENIRTVQYCIV